MNNNSFLLPNVSTHASGPHMRLVDVFEVSSGLSRPLSLSLFTVYMLKWLSHLFCSISCITVNLEVVLRDRSRYPANSSCVIEEAWVSVSALTCDSVELLSAASTCLCVARWCLGWCLYAHGRIAPLYLYECKYVHACICVLVCLYLTIWSG